MTTCVFYIRKSTEEHLSDGQRSREVQLAICQKIAEDNGYTHVGTYSQIVSGFSRTANRSEFERMLEDLQNRKFDVIVTFREDRLGRRVAETVRLFELCQQYGVRIHTQTRLIDPQNPQDALLYHLMAAIAQNESETTATRIKANRDYLKLRSWTGGVPPYGFTPTDRDAEGYKKLIPHPIEGRTVERMIELLLTEHKSIGEIAQSLTAEGHTTRTGQPWNYKAVQQVLLNPTLAGYATQLAKNAPSRSPRHLEPIMHQGRPVLIHQGIITPDQWEQVKAIVAPRTQIHRKSHRSPLLSGLVFCAECGRKMNAAYSSRKDRIFRRYQCPGQVYPKDTRCSNGISALVLEEFIEDYVRGLLKDDNLRAAFDAHRKNHHHTSNDTETRIKKLREAQTALTSQLHDTLNPHVIEAVTQKLNRITNELELLEEQRIQALLRHTSALTFEDIYNLFYSVTPTQRRHAIRQVLDRINIYPGQQIKGGRRGATTDMHRIELWVTGTKRPVRLPQGTPAPPTSKIECKNCNQLIQRPLFKQHYEECSAES
ncbi:recombinase family protein [Rothia sp. CCM 9416]|uniref:recombinase family protein n=1 Tax=Rothia sp. CCM 9416 TaxID=3402655 RepID=UPI003AD99642